LFLAGLLIGGALFAALLLSWIFEVRLAESLTTGLKLCFLALVTFSLVADIARSRRVNMDVVFGACCVYLLIGLIWAALYALLEAAVPGSFDLGSLPGDAGVAPSADSAQARLTYFSFITMTTVGYGDVTPLTAPARSLSMLQGLVGQLYLAIVIARLVGLEISTRMSERG
jgi:hypothetical protein